MLESSPNLQNYLSKSLGYVSQVYISKSRAFEKENWCWAWPCVKANHKKFTHRLSWILKLKQCCLKSKNPCNRPRHRREGANMMMLMIEFEESNLSLIDGKFSKKIQW